MQRIERIPPEKIEVPIDWRRRSPARLPRSGNTPAICVHHLDAGRYQLRSPWLRWRAVQRDFTNTLPCVVVAPCNENVLSLGKFALAVRALTDHSIRELAQALQVSFGHLAQAVRLAQLPNPVLEKISSGDLSPTLAKALIGLREGEQLKWAIRASQGRWSVRHLKKAISQSKTSSGRADVTTQNADLHAVQRLIAEKLLAPVNLEQLTNGSIAVRVRFFGPAVLAGLLERLSLAGQLESALESPGDLVIRFSDVHGFNQTFSRWFEEL